MLNSKIRLTHGLVSFQKERTSFLRNSTDMQVNEMVQNAREKISGNLDFVENNNFIRESKGLFFCETAFLKNVSRRLEILGGNIL